MIHVKIEASGMATTRPCRAARRRQL